ncbi:MAG TPA: GTPase HflX, partial [Acidimicrobiaceae bacterium]|nr:GTPase HflX [Acidimicrobiaceae bacterium]
NKADLDPETAATLVKRYPGSVAFSARTGEGVDELLAALSTHLRAMQPVVELSIPYERADALAAVHREGEVLVETHGDTGTVVQA